MKSLKTLLITLTLGTSLLFSACGTQKSKQAAPETTPKPSVTEKQTKTSPVEAGSKNMRTVINEMKTQLSNKEEDKLIKTSDKLEENWKLFEDDVKAKHIDLYKKLEDPLGIIQAGVKVKPLDSKIVTSALESLDKVLIEIQNAK